MIGHVAAKLQRIKITQGGAAECENIANEHKLKHGNEREFRSGREKEGLDQVRASVRGERRDQHASCFTSEQQPAVNLQ